ncbi:MAG: alanine racemase [Bacteroidales bacterium]|nr:alanine racemase [Bacteroidales bacterium]
MSTEINKIKDKIRRFNIKNVLTDSRAVSDGEESIFFALKTSTNDGHNYVRDLISRGVKVFVVERIPEGIDPQAAEFIIVSNVLESLQALASSYRQEELGATKVIAIGGFGGKTIIKEWLSEAIGHTTSVGRSPRSYNSQLGVALSLLKIQPGAKYAVIECGISEPGEMSRLSEMVQPETVVISGIDNNPGDFSSAEEKIRETFRLAAGAKALVYPAELDEAVGKHVSDNVLKISVHIPQDADWVERDRLLTLEALRLLKITMPENIIRPLETRLNVSQGVNNCLIISDRFSCTMDSLPSAIDFMRRRQADGLKMTLILDELRGSCNPEEIASLIYKAGIERVIAIGEEYDQHREIFPPGSRFFATGEEMLRELTLSDFSRELILAKGERGGAVDKLAETLQLRHHETVLEVNLDAIVDNFNHYRAMLRPETGIVAMVKASGYGAGAMELARTLQSHGAAYLAVAVVDEGEELRRAGITMPIMALNPKVTNYDSLFANRLEPEVFSFEMLNEIIREGERRDIKHYPIHIKFDTGMHRLGFLKHDISELCRRLGETDVVKVASVFSHLATADCLDMDDYTLGQLTLFTEICEQMNRELGYSFKRHILNSAGIARFPEYQFDMVRLGIGLYGIDTLGIPATAGLRQVSSLRSMIISLKDWSAETSIGYSRRTILDHDATIATVPVGYADGLDRHLGNGKGKVWINGKECPIVGNVCMDACMVDVTGADAKVGDSVEFFGPNLPVEAMSNALDTIPYEILTSVSPRVKRVYFRE